MPEVLRQIVRDNRSGAAIAIPSVCSAHPDVIRASLRLAERLNRTVVIEATSNQVNQFGGYTGMRPHQFVDFVYDICDAAGIDRQTCVFGGDHLGTQAWRAEPARQAMSKAIEMVIEYVEAGFEKIHLDCSEGCLGEAPQLDDVVTSERSAQLASAAAQVSDDLMFVVGTEVPPPGGARTDENGDIPATDPKSAVATLQAHDATFGDLRTLIGGLVVQPGVEFGPNGVHRMPKDRDPGFLAEMEDWPNVCLEAHSTDYQEPEVFPRLAALGFAFQKVGPALTFAYREALYALDTLRTPVSQLEKTMEDVMLAQPEHWKNHYVGDAASLRQQRHHGLADRIRYYWPTPQARSAVQTLFEDMSSGIPESRLSSVFSSEVLDRSEMLDGPQVQRLVDAQIETALAPYFFEDHP